MTIKEFLTEAHKTALEKGWWEQSPEESLKQRDLGEVVCLFHSEVSEALEAYRDPNHKPSEIWFGEEGKPEGVGIELADLLIRLADAVQGYSIDLGEAFLSGDLRNLDFETYYAARNVPGLLCQMHSYLTDLWRTWTMKEKFAHSLSDMMSIIFNLTGHIMRSVSGDEGDSSAFIEFCVVTKMNYNKNRPTRHGGKRC